jgi:type III secretion system YscQ/HrcQ family protein
MNQAVNRLALRIGAFDVDLVPREEAAPLAQALEAALAARAPAAAPRLMQWPLRTCVALGRRRMPRARFATLRPGDAVFGGLGGTVFLRIASAASPTWLAAAHLDNQGSITMTEQFHHPLDEAEPPDTVPLSATVQALAQLPLDIRYEIDGPRLNLAQAAELVAGDVLTLPVPADQAVVHLRCQGRVIARGELVNVGGHLGVRITEAGEGTWSA